MKKLLLISVLFLFSCSTYKMNNREIKNLKLANQLLKLRRKQKFGGWICRGRTRPACPLAQSSSSPHTPAGQIHGELDPQRAPVCPARVDRTCRHADET